MDFIMVKHTFKIVISLMITLCSHCSGEKTYWLWNNMFWAEGIYLIPNEVLLWCVSQ